MEESLVELTQIKRGAPVAGLLFVLLALWILAQKHLPTQAFFSRYPWGAALIDLLLFPASAFAIGLLVTRMLGVLGFETLQGIVHVCAELLLFLSLAYGVARVVEVWVASQQKKRASGATPGDRTQCLVRAVLSLRGSGFPHDQ